MADRKLPLLLALPHAGLQIPPEVDALCRLGREELIADSDEDASEIYALDDRVAGLVSCPVARSIVDVNRAEDDSGEDGAIKTVTRRGGAPVYQTEPPPELRDLLLRRYHRPYHRQLTRLAPRARLGIDCHTMAERQPGKRGCPPRHARKRPRICLSDDGHTCPRDLLRSMIRCLGESFGCRVSINRPFRGGYTIRRHAPELPWVQLELSRESYATAEQKRRRLLEALESFCAENRWSSSP
ncbi:MAG: N-formylglutamate amidohydrolase [Deltaproteobacteria bacterium]|nr:N-formylglutamate amidohydrolase [Deltaproteobacteria bacterium]